MNIKNRLKRMEAKIRKPDSDFCTCSGEIRTEVWIPHFDGEKYVRKLLGTPIPDVCQRCDKPFMRGEPLRITFKLNSNAELAGEA